jgi:predicted ATPase
MRRRVHGESLQLQWERVSHLMVQKRQRKIELDSELGLLRDYLSPHCEFIAMSRSCLQQWSIQFCKLHPQFASTFDSFLTVRTGLTPAADKEAWRRNLAPMLKRPASKKAKPANAVKRQISQTVKEFQAHEAAQASYSLSLTKKSEREKFFAKTQYIETIEIKNFKVIKHLKLTFSDTLDAGSWLLILGENGTGKSSVLHAVGLALMGEKERKRLGLNDGRRWATYPRKRGELVEGFVEVKLTGGGDPIRLDFRSSSRKITTNTPDPKVLLLGYSATRLLPQGDSQLSQGSQFSKTDNLFNPTLALTRSAQWLHSLGKEVFDDVVASLKRLMMLKAKDRFVKAAKGRIQVKAFGGTKVYLEELSAGYQSVVALSTDIISVLLRVWDSARVAEGIVLIDEIDAHLHPRWKMQIIERLRETFPRVQFLVTSHEPLTLRGLNQQEVAVMIRRQRGRVETITEDLPNPKALRVDQLLTSEFFGLSCTLSPELETDFNEYYALLAVRKRTPKQETRITELKAQLDGLRLMGDTPRERMMYEVIDEFLAQKEKRAPNIEELEIETRQTLLQMWQEV